MDNHKHDKIFYATFCVVLGILVGITVAISLIAGAVSPESGDEKVALKRIADRIAPVGHVVTDPAMLLKVSAPVAARAPMSGAEVATKVCAACHGSGVLGAPKTGDKADWGKRLAATGGLGGLVKSAIAGKAAMPPKGGDPSLSEVEIKAAVEVLMR